MPSKNADENTYIDPIGYRRHIVRLADILPIIGHPSELDHGEVRGEREAGATQTKAKSAASPTSHAALPGERRLTAL